MLTGRLKRLVVMVALGGFVGVRSERVTAVQAGPSSSRGGAVAAPVNHQPARRRRPPAQEEEGCRESPVPAPTPPAACS